MLYTNFKTQTAALQLGPHITHKHVRVEQESEYVFCEDFRTQGISRSLEWQVSSVSDLHVAREIKSSTAEEDFKVLLDERRGRTLGSRMAVEH